MKIQVNQKKLTFELLTKILADENHSLRPYVLRVLQGKYLASKELALELRLASTQGFDSTLVNMIGQALTLDQDTFRRYSHEWRKKQQVSQ